MFPWIYGFEWNAGHIFFLGAFYAVLTAVGLTVVAAARRSRRDLLRQRVEEIAWHSDFHELPERDRVCRHELNGQCPGRICELAFDCRHCPTHAALLRKQPLIPGATPEEDLFGMAFPLDRYYHRGHTWARVEADGTITVGLDALGQRLLGEPDLVELPPSGAHLGVNGTAFQVEKRGAHVRVLSPVEGEVLETGGPSRGWYLRILPEATGELALRHLLRGAEVKPWLMREMERLQLTLSAEGGASATLADGGVPVADISQAYPTADWDAVCGGMFLEP